eukprot:1235480-Karenia_brevis.AAC.1
MGSLAERFTQSFRESSESLMTVASFDNFDGLKRACVLRLLPAAVYVPVELVETAQREVKSGGPRVCELDDIEHLSGKL